MISEFFAWIKRAPNDLWLSWERFFFAPVSMLPAGVFRFLFSLNALIMYSIRFKDWRFYFTDAGFLPLKGVFDVLPDFYKPMIFWFPTTEGAAFAMNLVLIVCLLFLLVGLFPRVAAAIAFFCHLGLIQRNYAVAYGADFISTFMFFALIFIQSDRRFSLAAWWRSRKRRPLQDNSGSIGQIISSAGVRVMQLQLCLIYTYTGLEKMKGAAWWDGSAIWAVVGNQQIMFIDASWIKNVPLALAAMTFLTLLFEIYFGVLVWTPMRKWIIALGVMMHVGIALSIGLFYFSFGMICVYALFADPVWLERFLPEVGRVPRRWLGFEPGRAQRSTTP